MPDRVTKEERQVSLAIEKAREIKSMLTHKIHEEVPTDEKYGEPEEVKVKRPKAQNSSKITNQTQKKEGYGLAGESLKKRNTSSYSRVLNIEKFIGKTGAVEEIRDMIEKEFGKVKDGSTSSYSPNFIIPIDLQAFINSY